MKEPHAAVAAGAFCWRLQPEFARKLGPAGIQLEQWLRSGHATVVKQGPHRVVYRVALEQVTFYLKHNRTPDRVTWMRQLMRPSKARREFSRALEVAARGIPTAQPAGWAQEPGLFGNGESMLVTYGLDDTQPVHLFVQDVMPRLTPARRANVRQRLGVALGRFLARMHDAGICHNDLHAGNLLVRLRDNDEIDLFLIDLNDVSFGPKLTWRQASANLVILNHWFALKASRADRLRFWLSYLAARPHAIGKQPTSEPRVRRAWARHLERATWRSLQRLWEHRDRRCLVDNRYYRCLESALVSGHAVTDLDGDLTAQLLADPDAPFRRTDAVKLKDSATSTVIEFSGNLFGRATKLIYKRFCLKKRSMPVRSLMRKPPALRSWQMGQGFYERGLPTARPLLVLHRRKHGMFYEGYLLTEKIERARELHGCLDELANMTTAQRRGQLRSQIPLIAQAVRELHQRQISQRDLKASNILLATEAPQCTGPPKPGPSLLPSPLAGVWFLDLVGVVAYPTLPYRCRVQNLARLNASFHERPELTRTDRLRFLRAYLQWGLRGKHDWKKWWRALAAATEKKLARNQRIGRSVA